MIDRATRDLTFDERIRRAAGVPVDSVEDRIVTRALERLRPDAPTGDDVLRSARADATDRSRPTIAPRAKPRAKPQPVDDSAAQQLETEFDRVRHKRERNGRRLRMRKANPHYTAIASIRQT